MKSEFISLGEIDSKELRKQLGLPITKDIVYYHKEDQEWKSNKVVHYDSVGEYSSGSRSLLITLDDGNKVRIHSDYLSDMQKSNFFNETEDNISINPITVSDKDEEVVKTIKKGKKIDFTPVDYSVVDLETTGKNHKFDRIIEIGAIKYRKGVEVDRFQAYVKTDKTIPKEVMDITGINNEIIDNEGINLEFAIMALMDFLGNDIVIGHNFAAFDYYFLNDAYYSLYKSDFPNDFIDTLLIARKSLSCLNSHSLQVLSDYYNIDYTKAHRAVEDCIINHYVYEYLVFGKPLSVNETDSYLIDDNIEKSKELVKCIGEDNLSELKDINNDSVYGLKERIESVFSSIISERELPYNALHIMANMSRETENITSYSLCIYESDLVEDGSSVEKNSIILNISDAKLRNNPEQIKISSGKLDYFDLITIPQDATLFTPKTGSYIQINRNSENLDSIIRQLTCIAIANYTPKASSFACCSKYKECSEKKKCVHENRLYSKACAYRKNLELGNIFY